ncbi:hypothetical protein Tco_0418393 [Tanacetum coccineum]
MANNLFMSVIQEAPAYSSSIAPPSTAHSILSSHTALNVPIPSTMDSVPFHGNRGPQFLYGLGKSPKLQERKIELALIGKEGTMQDALIGKRLSLNLTFPIGFDCGFPTNPVDSEYSTPHSPSHQIPPLSSSLLAPCHLIWGNQPRRREPRSVVWPVFQIQYSNSSFKRSAAHNHIMENEAWENGTNSV